MSRTSQGVTFSVVDVRRREPGPSHGLDGPPLFEPVEDLRPSPVDQALGSSKGARARPDPFSADRFPLAGPIIERARKRELRGRCSSCESRIRLRVDGPGPKTVRCPICGHTRRITL